MSLRRNRWRLRAAAAAVALTAVLGSVVLATPAAAQERPSSQVRSGPNLTLVLANCGSSVDVAIAQELAQHTRHGAAGCLSGDGVPSETAEIIAAFAPDRVLIVGGGAAVPPAVMNELTAMLRSAYRWTVVQHVSGATRVETAAAAARFVLDRPDRVGTGTVTLVAANGWNDADVNTAFEFAATLDAAAVFFFSPAAAEGGLSDAAGSLITDYRPARIVFAGRADESGIAAETAARAVLQSIGSDVSVERVALAGDTPSPAIDTATLTSTAHATFEAISAGERIRPGAVGESQRPPFLALTMASGIGGIGSTLYTVRSDGSDRMLRTVDHNGWEWHTGDGRLAWGDNEGRVVAAAPDAEGELLVGEGAWPWWSPDGEHLLTWNVNDADNDGFLDSFGAVLHDADGSLERSLGQMDARTWYYGNVGDFIWSRDGAHMAYITGHIHPETSEAVNEARVEPTDGSAPPVTLGDDAIIVRWSPDAEHLLYATPGECGDAESEDIWHLWVVAADGSDARRIDTISFPEWSVVIINPWSPDGQHVAYEAVDPTDCSTELRVSTVDDSGEGDAAPVSIAADVSFLGWSPDSTYVEYGEETDRPVTDYLLPELSWIAHRDGSSKRFIAEVSPSAYGWLFWSHDGTHISYTEMLRDADGNVTGLLARTQRADGEGGTTTLAQSGNALSWSADGRAAYVAQHDDDGDGVPEREALYVHTPDSPDGDVELVHALPAPTRIAIWSPDNSHLIYASGSIESLIGWFRDRGRGVNMWAVETGQPRWTHRLTSDVTWGGWQPDPDAE